MSVPLDKPFSEARVSVMWKLPGCIYFQTSNKTLLVNIMQRKFAQKYDKIIIHLRFNKPMFPKECIDRFRKRAFEFTALF